MLDTDSENPDAEHLYNMIRYCTVEKSTYFLLLELVHYHVINEFESRECN